MVVHEFSTERRLHDLRLLCANLQEPAMHLLWQAFCSLITGSQPRRIWIYVPPPGEGEPYEITE